MIIPRKDNGNLMQSLVQDLSTLSSAPAGSSHIDVSKQRLPMQNSQSGHKRQQEVADIEVAEINISGSEEKHGGESTRKKKRKNKTKDGEKSAG